MFSIHSKSLLALAIGFGSAIPISAAEITWDGNTDGDGDGLSVFAEANYFVSDNTGALAGSSIGDNAPANFINGNADILADVVVGGSATAGGTGGANPNVDLGEGFTLTVKDNAVFRVKTTTPDTRGIRGAGTGSGLVIEDNGEVITQFLTDMTVTMSDASKLTLNGGIAPLDSDTTIDFAVDWTGSLTFNDETVSAATSEHLDNFTVGGAAAVIGVNLQIVTDGADGSIVTVIPEPGSLALLGIGGVLIGVRRRRQG